MLELNGHKHSTYEQRHRLSAVQYYKQYANVDLKKIDDDSSWVIGSDYLEDILYPIDELVEEHGEQILIKEK